MSDQINSRILKKLYLTKPYTFEVTKGMATLGNISTRSATMGFIANFAAMSKAKALIPNLLTAGNLVGGILAIMFALNGRLEWAPYCIFIAAFLDFFDGFAARLLKVQSELGKQLDSLADMVTFGVAPGIVMYQLIKASLWHYYELPLPYNIGNRMDNFLDANYQELLVRDYLPSSYAFMDSWTYLLLPYAALIIPVMSLFRLAKFNLDTRQTDSFIGLPTPANTLFFVSFPLIIFQAIHVPENMGVWGVSPEDTWQLALSMTVLLNPWFLVISSFVMSFMLVAELPLFALKFKSFGWKGNEIRYSFLTAAVVLLATLQWIALPLIIILYLLLSVIQNFRKR